MKLANKVQLIGNLGQEPEVVSFDSGKKLTKFTIATNESYKDTQGEKITETQWHNIVAWSKTGELMERYLKKGQQVIVEGKLSTRTYEDKEGVKRYFTEIIASDFMMLGSKKDSKK